MFIECYFKPGGKEFHFPNPLVILSESEIVGQGDPARDFVFSESHAAWVISRVIARDSTFNHLLGMTASPREKVSFALRSISEPISAEILADACVVDVLTFMLMMLYPDEHFCKNSLQSVFVVGCRANKNNAHVYRVVWNHLRRKFFVYHLPKASYSKASFKEGSSVLVSA